MRPVPHRAVSVQPVAEAAAQHRPTGAAVSFPFPHVVFATVAAVAGSGNGLLRGLPRKGRKAVSSGLVVNGINVIRGLGDAGNFPRLDHASFETRPKPDVTSHVRQSHVFQNDVFQSHLCQSRLCQSRLYQSRLCQSHVHRCWRACLSAIAFGVSR